MNELQEKIESKIKKTLKISYYCNKQNEAIVNTFLEFVDLETDGGRLQGIKRLLEHYSTDWKYESMFNELQSLKKLVYEKKDVKQEVLSEKSRKVKTFGREQK